MGLFPKFLNWTKSDKTGKVRYKSMSEKGKKDTNMLLDEYYDENEGKKQDRLWHEEEKKLPWYDAPPKVKVTTKKGICHMHMEYTVGLPPDQVYFQLTERPTGPFFDDVKWRYILQTKSSKILKDDGPKQIAKLEKLLDWEILWLNVHIPIHLIVDENRKKLTGKYKKEKMIFMKVFKGKYKVHPIYVDQERLCKHKLPKTPEEYKKCSDGQGRIASKVTMDQYFQPSSFFNLPLFAWYIRRKTIKTTEKLLISLQKTCATFRIAGRSALDEEEANKTSSNKHGKH